jgi:Icc-related predicted phosphoesterase
MKFDLVSDLHLDFGGIAELIHKPGSWVVGGDILVMAGDVAEIKFLKAANYARTSFALEFLEIVSKKYKHVLWVFGNHEFYNDSIIHARKNMKDILKKMGINNIHIIENETFEFDDTVFFGTTLWTGMNNGNPVVMNRIQSGLNDYSCIKTKDAYGDVCKLTANDTCALHVRSVEKIKEFISLKTDKKKVLITHHAPSFLSVPEEYKTNDLNHGYATELFDMLFDSDIRVAVHGHIHDPAMYTIGDCMVASNPRGYYGYETQAYTFQPMTINV